MAMNPGSPGFSMPAGEDEQVRKLRDAERTTREQAAARTLEASTIGKGGLLVKGGGSITVEAPGTIDLQGGAFSAATLSATSTISTPGTVQGGAVNSTGDMSAVNMTASGQAYSVAPFKSPGSRAYIVTTGFAVGYINNDGTIGVSSSSADVKQDIAPVDLSPEVQALYALALIQFRYIKAVEDMGENAPVEVGTIAEYAEAMGLHRWVTRDIDGKIDGINYERLTIPLIATVQDLNARLSALEAKLV